MLRPDVLAPILAASLLFGCPDADEVADVAAPADAETGADVPGADDTATAADVPAADDTETAADLPLTDTHDGASVDIGEADVAPPPPDIPAPPPSACPPEGAADVLHVGVGEAYETLGAAAAAAAPDAVIVLADGVYEESLTITSPVTICAANSRQATVTFKGRVFDIEAPSVALIGLVVDGQWGEKDIINANDASDNLVLRDLEVRNGQRDGIDIGGGNQAGCKDLLIEDCTIHHLLWGSTTDQKDAHCIVASDFEHLTIRNTQAYHCSGDSLQVGTDRDPWDDVLVEGCHFWAGPLSEAAADFQAGDVPGENAIDTKAKVYDPPYLGTIVLRDSVFEGFDPKSAYIGNRAALNLKNQITGVVERCTIADNEVGFRIRGGTGSKGGVSGLVLKNNVVYRNSFHARLEDDCKDVHFLHNTFGALIDSENAAIPITDGAYGSRPYYGGGAGDEGPGWLSDNNLFVGSKLPELAGGAGDAFTADGSVWGDFAAHDYHLTAQQNAPAGVGVLVDRDGVERDPDSPDSGAYEL